MRWALGPISALVFLSRLGEQQLCHTCVLIHYVTHVWLACRWEDIVDQVSEETKEEEGGMPPAEDEEPDIFELEGECGSTSGC